MRQTNMSRLGAVDVYSDSRALGMLGFFQDQDNTNPEAIVPVSATPIKAVYVMNDSGGTLAPGLGVKYKSGYAGLRVDSTTSANGICDGVVDPFLANAVPNGSYFWLIVQGPIDVEIGTGNIAAGDVVQTIASGKFATGTAGTNPIGHCGKAIEAANSGSRARVMLSLPFAAVQA